MIKSGIYIIINIVNGKTYIGKTKNLLTRYKSHLHRLRKNKHENSHLQNAFNLYKEPSFSYEIIEFVVEKDLYKREYFWINFYNSLNRKCGYNIEQINVLKEHKEVADETKYKLSQYKGNKHWAFGRKFDKKSKNKNDHLKKEYQLISPNGLLVKFVGLKEFCRQHSLRDNKICSLLAGTIKSHKGWTCPPNFSRSQVKNCTKRIFYLVNPENIVLYGDGLSRFCKIHSLNRARIRPIIDKKINSYLGWRLATEDEIKDFKVKLIPA